MNDKCAVNEGAYEDEHVHQVYNKIASHFSSTRFKPWPVVDEFLRVLPTGSVGLDVGCGNGKYLTVRKDIFIVASDRSSELIKFARHHQPHGAVIADTLNLPHPSSTFDFAICIAVIHHLSTPIRRQDSIRAILSTLRPTPRPQAKIDHAPCRKTGLTKGGQALIFVWALEQKSSRRGWDAGHQQDVLVPWVLQQDTGAPRASAKKKSGPDMVKAKVEEAITNTSTTSEPEVDTSKNSEKAKHEINSLSTSDNSNPASSRDQTYQRYYHLYREGELENDIISAGGRVIRNGYDRDNWWAICERID